MNLLSNLNAQCSIALILSPPPSLINADLHDAAPQTFERPHPHPHHTVWIIQRAIVDQINPSVIAEKTSHGFEITIAKGPTQQSITVSHPFLPTSQLGAYRNSSIPDTVSYCPREIQEGPRPEALTTPLCIVHITYQGFQIPEPQLSIETGIATDTVR